MPKTSSGRKRLNPTRKRLNPAPKGLKTAGRGYWRSALETWASLELEALPADLIQLERLCRFVDELETQLDAVAETGAVIEGERGPRRSPHLVAIKQIETMIIELERALMLARFSRKTRSGNPSAKPEPETGSETAQVLTLINAQRDKRA